MVKFKTYSGQVKGGRKTVTGQLIVEGSQFFILAPPEDSASFVPNREIAGKIAITGFTEVIPGTVMEVDDVKVNTRIFFLYRDESNYKVHNESVVAGLITPDQEKAIFDSLLGGDYFIPEMVGLEGERFSEITEDDTDFFELCYFEPTAMKPDTGMTVDELVEKFVAIGPNGWSDYCLTES